MRSRILILAIVANGFLITGSIAQETVPVTVQLPSFHVFSVRTTVVVPDSGRGIAARTSQARYGAVRAGAPIGGKAGPGLSRNRSIGHEVSQSGIGVRASVIRPKKSDRAWQALGGSSRSAARSKTDLAGQAIDYLHQRGREPDRLSSGRHSPARKATGSPGSYFSDGGVKEGGALSGLGPGTRGSKSSRSGSSGRSAGAR